MIVEQDILAIQDFGSYWATPGTSAHSSQSRSASRPRSCAKTISVPKHDSLFEIFLMLRSLAKTIVTYFLAGSSRC